METNGHYIVLLPGPPNELKAMFENEVRSRLSRIAPNRRLYTRDLRVAGMSESDADSRVAEIYKKYSQAEHTILAAPGEIQIHPRVWSDDPEEANRILDDLVKSFELALGENLYSTTGQSMEEVVAHELREHRATIATAESCTGGLIAARLTNIAGSSTYFLGGVVCYSNDLKTAWTRVPAGDHRIEGRGELGSGAGVGGWNSQEHRRYVRAECHGNCWTWRRNAGEARGACAYWPRRRKGAEGARVSISRGPRADSNAGYECGAGYGAAIFSLRGAAEGVERARFRGAGYSGRSAAGDW